MSNRNKIFLPLAGAFALAAAGVCIVILSSKRSSDPGSEGQHPARSAVSAEGQVNGALPATKSDRRPDKQPLDDGGLTPGTPEWHNTEAGRDFIRRLPKEALHPAPIFVETISFEKRQRIIERLKPSGIDYLSSLPEVNYEQKKSVPDDWKVVLKILHRTVAFALGRRGNEPQFAHADGDFFYFSNQHHEDFSKGYAVRKEDGALFQWSLESPITAEP